MIRLLVIALVFMGFPAGAQMQVRDENGKVLQRISNKEIEDMLKKSKNEQKALELRDAQRKAFLLENAEKIEVTLTAQRQPVYVIKINEQKLSVVSKEELTWVSQSILDTAKSVVCDLPILPETVDISISIVSGTWSTSKLCGK
ncbi:MAG: hypothetical protein KF681_07640 [Bdellovibrionaceae bacterium]|nr:hypothetical protein [Pseudobdellovibrionaceae bacterium]